MTRPGFLVLLALLLLPAGAARAQYEPFRVVNGATVPAIALHLLRSGQEGWGPNLLVHGPLAPGAALSLRPPEAAGCRFDIRLVLQDGREAIRRDADVCRDRTQRLEPGRGAD